MTEPAFMDLVHNVALLLALVLVFDQVSQNLRTRLTFSQKVLIGLTIGSIGAMIMLSPWIFIPGIIFDTRSILLGISGLFFGSIPTIVAMLITSGLRMYQGGAGVVMGVSVIIASGTIGIFWRRLFKRSIIKMSALEFYFFGVVIHIVMLLLAFTIPMQTALLILSNISLPVLVIYPVGTMLLGMLMAARMRRDILVDKITESETRYKIVADNTFDWEYWFNPDGRFEYCSPSCLEISGYTPEEYLKDSEITWKMIHPDDMEVYKKHREAPAEEKKGRQMDFRIIRPDGSIRWIGHVCRPVYDNNGNPMGTRGSNRDITEQKQAVEALRESEEKYRLLMENQTDWISKNDPEGRYIYTNPAFCDMFCKEEGDLIGNIFNPTTHPEDVSVVQNALTKVFHPPYECSYDARYMTKHGWTWTNWTVHSILNDKEEVTAVIFSGRDITERMKAEEKVQSAQVELQKLLAEADQSRRVLLSMLEDQKRAEEALEQEQYLMRTLMDTIPDTIYFKDITGRFLRVNKAQAKRLGVPEPKELLGKTDFDFFSQEHAQTAFDKELSIIQTGHSIINDEEILTYKDRAPEWVSSTKMPLLNQNSEIIGTYGVSRDISERKQAEEQLQTAYDATLQGWAAALELREKETANHSRHVVDLTLRLAKEFDISKEDIVHIRRGALLHDIGKMGIPDSILLKPGPLTDDEWVIMRMHPIFAFELLSDIPYLQPALDIPYAHHERWDGSGYPLGLKGTNIPLTARIFAVVDVWDALSSDRPYRPAWNKEAVHGYLREKAGEQFDPKIVEVFLHMIENPIIPGSVPEVQE